MRLESRRARKPAGSVRGKAQDTGRASAAPEARATVSKRREAGRQQRGRQRKGENGGVRRVKGGRESEERQGEPPRRGQWESRARLPGGPA